MAIQSACMLVIAALSGMRASELAEIGSTSCPAPAATPDGRARYRIASKVIKKDRPPRRHRIVQRAVGPLQHLAVGEPRGDHGPSPWGTQAVALAA